jgi:hypothetical protein
LRNDELCHKAQILAAIFITGACHLFCLGFEVFTAVTMQNAVCWDLEPCVYITSRRFGGMFRFHLQGRKNTEREEEL